MICQPCRDEDHKTCTGPSWCDCQHRVGDVDRLPPQRGSLHDLQYAGTAGLYRPGGWGTRPIGSAVL